MCLVENNRIQELRTSSICDPRLIAQFPGLGRLGQPEFFEAASLAAGESSYRPSRSSALTADSPAASSAQAALTRRGSTLDFDIDASPADVDVDISEFDNADDGIDETEDLRYDDVARRNAVVFHRNEWTSNDTNEQERCV